MSPIAFQIGGLTIYWYGILVAAALMLGFWIARRNALSYGVRSEGVDDLLFKLAIALLVGARLGAIVGNLSFYLEHPREILARSGLGFHGALFACMIGGYFWAKRARISYWVMADAIAPGITVGHIFVRFGNFLNGELYGPPTEGFWGVNFPTTAGPVHPSQLYEVFGSLIILPFAFRWAKKPLYPGHTFLQIILVHSLLRFIVDFVRRHSEPIGPFVLTQWIALGLVVLTVLLLTTGWLEKRYKANVQSS